MDQAVTGWKRYMLVQPPILLMIIALSMSSAIFTNLVVYRTCITMKINETECLLLNTNSKEAIKINSKVQPNASLILMSKSFIESIFPTVLSLFLGPWSDKYGRKPLLLAGYIGISLTHLLIAVMSNQNISPWYLLTAYIPIGLLGGIYVLMLASFCYITDITDDSGRAWHMAWIDALLSLGLLIGFLSGPLIFEAYGYTVIFSISTVLCITATLYILLVVPETVQKSSSGIYKIFDCTLVKDLIDTCVRKRDGFDRSLVWCCIACLTFLLITVQGELAIQYLFVSARLGWTVETYSYYVAISLMFGIIGTLFGVKVMRNYAGVPEAILAAMSVMSSLGGALVYAFTWQSWHMYLSVFVTMFSGISKPMIRAILSKAVPVQDIGKVFSLATSLETLLPFAAASLYTLVYTGHMPPLYPLPVWFLSVVFYTISIIILIYIQKGIIKRNGIPYVSVTENDSSR